MSAKEERKQQKGIACFIAVFLACSVFVLANLNSHQVEGAHTIHLEKELDILVNEKIREHKIMEASVYVIDLTNKKAIGFHENEEYSPASLLKVPILLAYLKQLEGNPNLREFALKNDIDPALGNMEYFPHKGKLAPNGFYMVDDLAKRMIRYSDNQAMYLLIEVLGTNTLDKTVSDLGITLSNSNGNVLMSPKEYATFFLALYNASYLDKQRSQEALTLLSQSDFTQGIVGGVPSSLVVAHKYGERGGEIKQLHDCGIVYLPQSPYFLCVMTMGQNMENLSETITSISRMIYEEKIQEGAKSELSRKKQ